MIEINKELFDSLFVQAESSDRKRINHDLRTSLNDGGQRMLNAMLRSTIVPIHRHPMSNENVILLVGKMDEVFYDDNGIETERIHLDPSKGNYGCVVPQCAWHTVEVLEPCVIYEAKAKHLMNISQKGILNHLNILGSQTLLVTLKRTSNTL